MYCRAGQGCSVTLTILPLCTNRNCIEKKNPSATCNLEQDGWMSAHHEIQGFGTDSKDMRQLQRRCVSGSRAGHDMGGVDAEERNMAKTVGKEGRPSMILCVILRGDGTRQQGWMVTFHSKPDLYDCSM